MTDSWYNDAQHTCGATTRGDWGRLVTDHHLAARNGQARNGPKQLPDTNNTDRRASTA